MLQSDMLLCKLGKKQRGLSKHNRTNKLISTNKKPLLCVATCYRQNCLRNLQLMLEYYFIFFTTIFYFPVHMIQCSFFMNLIDENNRRNSLAQLYYNLGPPAPEPISYELNYKIITS